MDTAKSAAAPFEWELCGETEEGKQSGLTTCWIMYIHTPVSLARCRCQSRCSCYCIIFNWWTLLCLDLFMTLLPASTWIMFAWDGLLKADVNIFWASLTKTIHCMAGLWIWSQQQLMFQFKSVKKWWKSHQHTGKNIPVWCYAQNVCVVYCRVVPIPTSVS